MGERFEFYMRQSWGWFGKGSLAPLPRPGEAAAGMPCSVGACLSGQCGVRHAEEASRSSKTTARARKSANVSSQPLGSESL